MAQEKDLRHQRACNLNIPRLVGEVLHDHLDKSNAPLAVAYRKHLGDEADDSVLFKDLFPTTELAINLKLLLRTPRRLAIGEMVPGVITHDGDDHFSFLESAIDRKTEAVKRNPCIMQGKYINVHRKDDGTPYPTFCRPTYTPELTFGDFCRKAAEELLAVAGFVGK